MGLEIQVSYTMKFRKQRRYRKSSSSPTFVDSGDNAGDYGNSGGDGNGHGHGHGHGHGGHVRTLFITSCAL